ncbi:hypothetical protein, partial [Stenotrophomonas maltophilia]|uniref:hypothetical protein n=1 Tax=Stenotrophomonas maltophilia TaxID=40324 RepID=UPI001952A451
EQADHNVTGCHRHQVIAEGLRATVDHHGTRDASAAPTGHVDSINVGDPSGSERCHCLPIKVSQECFLAHERPLYFEVSRALDSSRLKWNG